MSTREIDPDDVLECIVRGDRRREVMERLRDGPTELRELSEQLGMPRTTLRHSVEQLADHGLLAQVHAGKYRMTCLGRAALDGLATYDTHVETAIEVEPFMECVPVEELGIELSGLSDVTLTEATRRSPYAPSRSLVEAMTGATEVVGFTPVVPAVSQRPFESLVTDEESTLQLVVTRAAADAIRVEFDGSPPGATEHTTIEVIPRELQVGGFVLDGRAYLQGFDNNGKPHVLLETESSAVREWIRDRFTALRRSAGPLAAAQLERPLDAE